MASLNNVMLIGNLTRDPEIRYTPKGTAVADISIAINRTWTNDAGDKQEDVTYVEIVLWKKLAELAEKFLAKGRSVFVEGRLDLQTWDDKATGQKRSKLRVIGENLQFLGSKPDGSRRTDGPPEEDEPPDYGGPKQQGGPASRHQSRPPEPRTTPPKSDTPGEAASTDGLDDDDIPF